MKKKLLIMLGLIGFSLLWIRFDPEDYLPVGYSFLNSLGYLVSIAAAISVIVVINSIPEPHLIELLWERLKGGILTAVGLSMLLTGGLSIIWGGFILKNDTLGVIGAVASLIGIILLNKRVA